MMEELEIKIKYFDKEIDKIEKIDIGDWIDLRAAEDTTLFLNERTMIPLGVGMKLPEGYEAIIAPRSSLQKKGVIMGNSIGIIDNSYCGNEDQWHFPAMLVAEPKGGFKDMAMTYQCQFRIQKIQPKIKFVEVESLDEVSRGGIGSTGKSAFTSDRLRNAHSDYHIIPDEDLKRMAAEHEQTVTTEVRPNANPAVPYISYRDSEGRMINTGLTFEDLTNILKGEESINPMPVTGNDPGELNLEEYHRAKKMKQIENLKQQIQNMNFDTGPYKLTEEQHKELIELLKNMAEKSTAEHEQSTTIEIGSNPNPAVPSVLYRYDDGRLFNTGLTVEDIYGLSRDQIIERLRQATSILNPDPNRIVMGVKPLAVEALEQIQHYPFFENRTIED